MHAGPHKTGPKWTSDDDRRLEEVVRIESATPSKPGSSRAAFWSRVARRMGYTPSCSTTRRCARRWAKLEATGAASRAPPPPLATAPGAAAVAAAAPSPVDVTRPHDVLVHDVLVSDADDRALVVELAQLLMDDIDSSTCASDLSACEVLSVTTVGSLSSIGEISELDEALFSEATNRLGDDARPARAHAQRRAARRANAKAVPGTVTARRPDRPSERPPLLLWETAPPFQTPRPLPLSLLHWQST